MSRDPDAASPPEPAGSPVADGDPVGAIAALGELRTLADVLRRVEAAAAAAEWDDDRALARVVAEARAELSSVPGGAGRDIAAAGASAQWLARAEDHARGAALTRDLVGSPAQASANAVVAVGLARAAVAEAVLAVAQARGSVAEPRHPRGRGVLRIVDPLPSFGRRVGDELRHIVADKPRSILMRLALTLGISLSLVTVYHFSGSTRYDDLGNVTLYLFSAVVGSVVCTNALCFDAERVREALSDGERMWQILVAKNLAMAVLIAAAGFPVIALLTLTAGVNPIAMIDQLVTMVFIWLGVGNVLSVVSPLRHQPVPARLGDGTWKPYLLSFAVSYGIGLTVNLMIYWRLWARQRASEELTGGQLAAFALVLASAVTSWVLLTVFAVACSREPRIRRVLSREMVVYRKADKRPDATG